LSSVPPGDSAGVDQVLYDGTCGLCHGAVKRLVRLDRGGTRFRFAPLEGETAARLLEHAGPQPDSVLVCTPDGRVLSRWSAVRHVLKRLGGLLTPLAWVAWLVPRALGDWLYDAVARRRRRLAKAPSGACPLLPPDLARRFDP
jgi:predicted DCC family thiol-disulfide oxidoreductase YuxK